VLAVVRFITAKLQIKPAHIVMVGHSYGAAVALHAGAIAPTEVRGIVVASYLPRGLTPIAHGRLPPIVAIHGVNDGVAPLQAVERELKNVAGEMGGWDGRVTAVKNEGHNFQQPSSWARVYLTAVGLTARR
jgi:pimeloyl-ACP methyl ester carboxylesterase